MVRVFQVGGEDFCGGMSFPAGQYKYGPTEISATPDITSRPVLSLMRSSADMFDHRGELSDVVIEILANIVIVSPLPPPFFRRSMMSASVPLRTCIIAAIAATASGSGEKYASST